MREWGEVKNVAQGLTKAQAMQQARTEAIKSKGIFVEWFRSSDGQRGYLNQDGNHAITGEEWISE